MTSEISQVKEAAEVCATPGGAVVVQVGGAVAEAHTVPVEKDWKLVSIVVAGSSACCPQPLTSPATSLARAALTPGAIDPTGESHAVGSGG
eukprot:scaffold259326_cov27-Tisochrysis_lutea.AAC.2